MPSRPISTAFIDRGSGWLGGGLFGIAIAMRINNAFRYRTGNGFDAVENVEYIELLTRSWALPSPEVAWATSHPPLFYYSAAGLWHFLAQFSLQGDFLVVLPLLISLIGFVPVIVAMLWVKRVAPASPFRMVLAAGLLLFLPVHIYMSPMIGEELIATAWLSLALLFAWLAAPIENSKEGSSISWARVGLVGVFLGLALLTKMTGALVLCAIAAAWLVGGWRTRQSSRAFAHCGLMIFVSIVVGGWYYFYTYWSYGYLYPQDLEVHQKIFEMPPGHREIMDYLRFPLATFTDPQLLNGDLLQSVWGGTYDTFYFDGHRHFLGQSVAVTRIGTALTVLGLLPTVAFAAGMYRGIRRALRRPEGGDLLLVLTVIFLLVGYVVFTWNNPWYVTVKASYLLALSVPFAVYTSESLAGWMARGGFWTWVIGALLVLWLLGVVVTFTIGPVFDKIGGPGLPWQSISG